MGLTIHAVQCQASMPAAAAAGATTGRGSRSVRMVAAYLDAGGSYRVEGERTDAKVELRSLRLESHVNLNNEVIEQKLAGQVRLLLAVMHCGRAWSYNKTAAYSKSQHTGTAIGLCHVAGCHQRPISHWGQSLRVHQGGSFEGMGDCARSACSSSS